MSRTMRWSMLVAGEAALVLFLLTWGNTFTGSIPLHRVQIGILGILGGIGWLVILRRPGRLPTLLVVAPLPILASLAVTSLFSAYPSLSWFATWQCAAYVGIAWLLAIQAQHPVGRRNLVAAMGIVVTVVIGVYLAEVAFAWVEWLKLGFPVTSLPLRPLGDGGLLQLPTWVADVLALSAPVVAAGLWDAKARVAAIAWSAIALTTIVISGTRAVLLLTVVAAVLAAALVTRARASRRVAVFTLLGSMGVVVVGLGVVLLAGRSLDEGRSSAYASAIAQFLSSPIDGTGPGTFGVLRMADSVDALSRLAHPDAHNIILTAAGESGLIGLVGLGLASAAYLVAARRAWRGSRHARALAAGALLGIAVVAGHAMGEVVFALIGVVLAVLASIAIAATRVEPAISPETPRSRRLDLGLLVGVAVIVVSSTFLARTEMTLDAVAQADRLLPSAASAGLVSAREATDASPDSVPGWWVRMVAADATGDAADALGSARRIVALEGFGQEWLSIGVLLGRAGDQRGADDAIASATAHLPLDPVVELNAVILYTAEGDPEKAQASARRLLMAQPDIEPVLATGPAGLAAAVAGARVAAATQLLSEGDQDSAFLVALSADDHALTTSLLDAASRADASAGTRWRPVIAAWFGDGLARATVDSTATIAPGTSALEWSWRLAVRACDPAGADRWQRANEIGAARHLVMPIKLGISPDFQVRSFPSRYPGAVWRMDHPERPYVAGVWTYLLDRSACAIAAGD